METKSMVKIIDWKVTENKKQLVIIDSLNRKTVYRLFTADAEEIQQKLNAYRDWLSR